MKKKSFVPTTICFLLSTLVFAQEESFNHPELEWFTIETEHFYVHYHRGEERSAKVVAKIAEEIYEPITALYHHQPDQKVSIVVKDYDDYSNGAAYFYDNKIEIWALALDFDLRGTHNWLRNVVTHEFTHIVQMQTAMKFGRRIPAFYVQWFGYEAERRPDVLYGFPNVVVSYPLSGFVIPSWFAEGVAQYNRPELGYDIWDTHRDMVLRMYALDGKMLSWNEMSVFGKTSLGNEASYNAGFSFVHYIAEQYGEEKLREISWNLSTLTELTIDGAIQRAIGKSGREVYEEWKASQIKSYSERVESIRRSLVEGEIIGSVGFGNFYPAFSPDGKKIAYVSNKDNDYFSLSSLFIYDIETRQEKEVQPAVRTAVSWSPDGKKLYYSRSTRENRHWSNLFDIYEYNLENQQETRLTFGLRANNICVSPDGARLVFVTGSDGTTNLGTVNVDGTDFKLITSFHQGEQVYTPKYSPDGKQIVFGYSEKEGQAVGIIDANGSNFKIVINGTSDSRHPVYSPDGSKILFSSDHSGIFNIYAYNMATGKIEQLTNVLGGAFMPSINQQGDLAFASYTSTGYKLALLKDDQPLHLENVAYARTKFSPSLPSHSSSMAALNDDNVKKFDFEKLRHYDDTQTPDYSSRAYRSIFSSLSVLPVIRFDNYNKRNSGLDIVKPGFFFTSSDMLDKYSLFAGGAINKRGERDLFLIFEYKDRVPLFYNLGLDPTVSLEVYNISRKTDVNLLFGPPESPIVVLDEVTYSLLEFDVSLRQKIFNEHHDIKLNYTHSRYNADLGSFIFPAEPPAQPQLVPASSNLYFIGNNLSVAWHYRSVYPSRDQEINPVGRKIELKYQYEFSKFNSTGDYEATSNGLFPKYTNFRFSRLEGNWIEHIPFFGRKPTLTVNVRGGTIFGYGKPVNDFFDFYIGGLTGMKGYPFYSLGGNSFAAANLTHRFPLLENINVQILHLYFDKFYGAIYGDFGDAWFGDAPRLKDFKKDVGFELRLESYSFYVYPTRVFFNASYGFDRFSRVINGTPVTYGKEWRFYFGVLFGFDLF